MIGMALNDAEQRRVESTLQPAEVSASAVAGLTQLVSELAECLTAVSTPGVMLRIVGSADDESYLISITPHGPGISTDATGLLNRMLEEQDLVFRLASIARLAARLGIELEFLPTAAGSAARLTIPNRVVTGDNRPERQIDLAENQPVIELTGLEPARMPPLGPSEWAWKTSEEFLARVFSTLHSNGHAGYHSAPDKVTILRVRIPGESYRFDEDESPSIAAAEAAVDLKAALSSFEQGRRRDLVDREVG